MKQEISENFFGELKQICDKYGWALALDYQKDGISGVVIGKNHFINDIISGKEDFSKYTVFSLENKSDEVLQ